MPDLTMPTGGLSSVKFTLNQPAQTTRSDWTGTTRILMTGVPRWRATVGVVPGRYAKAQPWRAFQTGLNGIVNTFMLTAVHAAQTGIASCLCNGASVLGAPLLAMRGLPASTTVLPAGALVTGIATSTVAQLFVLAQPLVSDSAGNATASVTTPVRIALGDGYAVALALPWASMRLTSADAGWTSDVGHILTPFAFDCEESF